MFQTSSTPTDGGASLSLSSLEDSGYCRAAATERRVQSSSREDWSGRFHDRLDFDLSRPLRPDGRRFARF